MALYSGQFNIAFGVGAQHQNLEGSSHASVTNAIFMRISIVDGTCD